VPVILQTNRPKKEVSSVRIGGGEPRAISENRTSKLVQCSLADDGRLIESKTGAKCPSAWKGQELKWGCGLQQRGKW